MLRALVFSGLFLFIGCKPTLTCNPDLDPLNAGCSASEVCDPSGICRQKCTEGGSDSCPSGQACDNSGSPASSKYTSICQTQCESPGNICPSINGNPHECFVKTTPAPSGTSESNTLKVCKRVVNSNGCASVDTVSWCNPKYGLSNCTNYGGFGLCLPEGAL